MTARTLHRTNLHRTTIALVMLLLVGGMPRIASAQLRVTGACVPPACGSVDFFLTNVTDLNRPLNLTTLRIDLTNGWTFAGAGVTGSDDVGAFGPFDAAVSGDGTSTTLDFASWIDWFALDNTGNTGSVEMAVVGGGDEPLAFAWFATEVTGATYEGSFGARPSVVPEPAGVLLLGSGLAGIALAHGARRVRRRRSR